MRSHVPPHLRAVALWTLLGAGLCSGEQEGAPNWIWRKAANVDAFASSLASQAAPALSVAGSLTSRLQDAAKSATQRATVSALLWSSGGCPSLYDLVPAVPGVLVPRLAELLQEAVVDPSGSQSACEQAVRPGLAAAVDRLMENRTAQERLSARMVAGDRASRVCSEATMGALRTMEPIRARFSAQYREAVEDRLYLKVFTTKALTEDLDQYCGAQEPRAREGEEQEERERLHITTDLNQLVQMQPVAVAPIVGQGSEHEFQGPAAPRGLRGGRLPVDLEGDTGTASFALFSMSLALSALALLGLRVLLVVALPASPSVDSERFMSTRIENGDMLN